ncbi:MAG: DNA internalization-related competence protein ComEC/Rec2 [Desulfococcaceae bacterium]
MKKNLLDWGQEYSGFPKPDEMRDPVFFRPLIPLVFALIFGIVCGEQYPGLGCYARILLIFCTIVILRAILRKTPLLIPPLLLFFCLGYLSIQHWTDPDLPADHISRHIGPNYRKICGTVRSSPEMQGDRIKFILHAQLLDDNIPVSGRMLVTGRAEECSISPGDRIAFSGKIRNISSFSNPGAFDYRRHMSFQSVWCTVYIRKNSLSRLKENPEQSFFRSLENFRIRTDELIRKNSPEDAGAVLSALIIGYKNSISDSLRNFFSQAGIAHLLAISGLHMGMIATFSFAVFLWAGYRILPGKQFDDMRCRAAFFSLFPMIAYGMISGLSPATQRALIMGTVCIAAVLINKNQDTFNTMTIAAMLILIIHPPGLFSISFQLSFVAVAAIIFGFSLNFQAEKEIGNRITEWLFSALKSSFFAIMGTMPLTMCYFSQFSLTGLISNLIFIPLIGLLILPLGLSGVFISLFSMAAAEQLIEITAFMLSYSLAMLPFFANLPLSSMKTFTPTLLETALHYLLFWAACILISSEKEKRLRKYAFTVLILTLTALAGDVLYWMHQRFWHKDLEITVIDVGQGSSALIEFPGGKSMLIDGGGFYDPSSFDVGAAVVAPFLWQKKIMSADIMVLSHPEGDHMNGLFYIARHFAVKELWTSGAGISSDNYKYFMETVKKAGIRVPDFSHIPGSAEISGVKIEILWPPADFLQTREKELWLRKYNNTSLTVRISLGDFSILFPGDIETVAEAELVKAEGKNLRTKILVAPHHGCGTSSSSVFLDHVLPESVIISAGLQNRFNCPSPEVVTRYEERGCTIYRTDMHGAVSISVEEGKEAEIRTHISKHEKIPLRKQIDQQ